MDVSIVIVNWNVKELLRRCLLSIDRPQAGQPQPQQQALPPPTREIIVVDCASSDGSVDMVQREFPQVQLIAHSENLGYSKGNNLGAARAQGRYIFIINPDTEVVGDALITMVRYMDEHPKVGVAGPRLRFADGTPQPSRRRFPTLMTAFWESTLLHQWFPNNRFARHYYMADLNDEQAQAVDWLVGAALIVRRTTWEQVGPLDEDFFMYFEELDWCRRCRAAGWEVHYLPQACLVHHEGKSSEQVVAARSIRFQRSKIHYFSKYFGSAWGQVVRWFLLATFAFQLAEEWLKWLIGHKRALRKQRVVVYWQVLKSGLRSQAPPKDRQA